MHRNKSCEPHGSQDFELNTNFTKLQNTPRGLFFLA